MRTPVDSSSNRAAATGAAPVEDICARLEREDPVGSALLRQFTRVFFARVPRQLVAERSMEDLVALNRGAFRFLESAREGRVNVEVLNPEEEGWRAPITIIRAEVGDRPFIVDTIREYLSAVSLPIQHYVYPVIGVARDEDGRLTAFTDSEGGNARALVHCEVPPIPSADRRAEIRDEIERRLGDVVAATSDFQPMLEMLRKTRHAVGRYALDFPDRAAEVEEVADFLGWLSEANFVFLGYREYRIRVEGEEGVLYVTPGSGLGILRREEDSAWAEGVALSDLTESLRKRVLEGPLLITTKTNAEATVHRRTRMDYIGVKILSEAGSVIGERRFLGLFTSRAYAEHADAIPILRRKLEAILSRSGAAPGSHDYKEIITIFNSMPKEELFQASVVELEREVQTVLSLLFSDEVEVSLRADPLDRGGSVMVLLPRGKFSGEVRQRIQESLRRRLQGTVLNYHLAMSAGDQARLHFYLTAPPEVFAEVRAEELAFEIRQILRSWADRLRDELDGRFPSGEANRLATLYGAAFPEEYRVATLPEIAVQDLEELERLRKDGNKVAITLREPRGRGRAEAFRDVTVLKLYLIEERLILSDFMPILENAGLRVIEVAPFALAGEGIPEIMIYSFAVQDPDGYPIQRERAGLLAESLLAVRAGETSNDPFNALVLRAGLHWREVDVLRVYGNFAFQAGIVPTRYVPARAMARHPELARLIVGLFLARFEPETTAGEARSRLDEIRRLIASELDAVSALADDRAIRRMASLVEATVRTNFFRGGGLVPSVRSGGVPYISIKIAPGDIEVLRRTRLRFEIYVYSSRMEGIHLRGAHVSRGGIRWSDRLDDFRTEVLGLVQTQIVKNAVIVPGGSKGGFVTKRIFADRQATMQEVQEQYRTFMRGMLDITDNLVDGEVVPPDGVTRYDEDDPYLVVAADKGTAHLSDVANAVAAEYGFWLGDAFASGGSRGYDHKKEGITARGAWECVKRHFREMGKDIQREPFSVAGIGDMSGDVFGNGMLLSRRIRLLAAFDHRHVFIDPEPDPETSFQERERLFQMENSSWGDYDRSKLSPGAMIVPRSSKEVVLTEESREALGIAPEVKALDGEALIRAILSAPVDLLWNGGIGTYVKASEETNAEVGDANNDPLRIDADQLRCRVVGEGGNLGLTQRARIGYALRGGRLNTDAIDNSGGVDMSDHEVNLKILLAPRVTSGAMSFEERNRLLEEMKDEISALVLRNNVSQSLAISLDEARSREALADFSALITFFERDRLLRRRAEGIPESEELEQRVRDGLGLMRPTLCVLLAYAKLQAKSVVLGSDVPDDPSHEEYLIGYFPDRAVGAAGPDRLRQHRLRREVIATAMVSDLVDLMGATFLYRVATESGRSIPEVVAAWYVASRISGASEIRADLSSLEGHYPTESIYRWLFGLARVLERTTRWVLDNVGTGVPRPALIAELTDGLDRLRGQFGRIVAGGDRDLFVQRVLELRELGRQPELAERLTTLRFLPELLDILRVAREEAREPIETARAYYLIADHFGIAWMQKLLRGTQQEEHWEKRLAQLLLADLQRSHRMITREVLAAGRGGRGIVAGLSEYERGHGREVGLYRGTLGELRSGERHSIAGCAVAIRALAELSGR